MDSGFGVFEIVKCGRRRLIIGAEITETHVGLREFLQL
jgi:hypothetical protein